MIAHLIFVSVGYVVISSIEWAFHRYCMHAIDASTVPTKGLRDVNRQHMIHHAATKVDMTVVDTKEVYKKAGLPMRNQRFQGLYFVWPVTIMILVGTTIGGAIFNWLLGCVVSTFVTYAVSRSFAMSVAAFFALYMSILWNYFHPTLHFEKGLDLSDGLDILPRREWMKDTFVYNWLWRNHVLHHLLTGANAGNFNVTLPGADWLFGTYHTRCDGYELDVKNKIIRVLKSPRAGSTTISR